LAIDLVLKYSPLINKLRQDFMSYVNFKENSLLKRKQNLLSQQKNMIYLSVALVFAFQNTNCGFTKL